MKIWDRIKKVFNRESNVTKDNKKARGYRRASKNMSHDIDSIYLKPLENGLLPGEVILIKWLDGKYLSTSFPGYFQYRYGIDAKKSARKLLEKGFVRKSTASEALSSLKVSELKEILRENALKVSGRKAELINRIKEHLPESDISHYFNDLPLKISSKGQETLDEYDYIFPAHQYDSQDGIYNVATAIKYVQRTGHKSPSGDISWALYQEASLKYHKNLDFGLYRNVHLSMAEQLEREGKKQGALIGYLEICILDLSGLGNGGYLMSPDLVMLAPGILQRIKSLCESEQIDSGTLKKLFEQAWTRILPSLPFHYLDQETCYKCLTAAFKEDDDFINDVIMNSYERINRKTFESRYHLKLPLGR